MTDGEQQPTGTRRFWQIVADANRRPDELARLLNGLSPDEIYEFQDTFLEMSVELQDIPYSEFLDDDQSEDGLEDVAHWVVSQGRESYEAVLSDASLMPSRAPDQDSDLFGVAYAIYRDKTGHPLELL